MLCKHKFEEMFQKNRNFENLLDTYRVLCHMSHKSIEINLPITIRFDRKITLHWKWSGDDIGKKDPNQINENPNSLDNICQNIKFIVKPYKENTPIVKITGCPNLFDNENDDSVYPSWVRYGNTLYMNPYNNLITLDDMNTMSSYEILPNIEMIGISNKFNNFPFEIENYIKEVENEEVYLSPKINIMSPNFPTFGNLSRNCDWHEFFDCVELISKKKLLTYQIVKGYSA